jgi:hypothetical protein
LHRYQLPYDHDHDDLCMVKNKIYLDKQHIV